MKKNRAANIIIFVVLLILATVGMFLADQIQQGFLGNVKVTNGVISTEYGDLTYKLYTPASATKAAFMTVRPVKGMVSPPVPFRAR